MKKMLSNIFSILICLLIIFYPLVTGVISLADKKNHHSEKIYAATSILEIEHSINGLIPTGKDYYYIGVADDGKTGYIISGAKNWLEKNFDSNGIANSDDGVEITGHAKQISDYKIETELSNRLQQLDKIDFTLGEDVCLDVAYKFKAIKSILAGVLLLISSVIGILCFKAKLFTNNKIILFIFIASLLGGLVLMINSIT